MGVDKALELLLAAGLAAIVYTSASHTPAKPRLRVICPTSVSLPPEQRKSLVARLNGALKGALAGESFTDSLSYYYGRIEGNPHYRVEIIDGRGIDEATELDAGALGRDGKPYRVEIIDGRGIDEATELDAGALGRNGKPYYGQQQRPSPVSDDELRPEPDLKFIARAIEFIPVRCRDDREGYWRPVMMALHNAAGGSEEAYRVLDRWSQGDGLDKCKKYDPADQRRVWNSLGHYQPEEQITLGTLFQLCKKHGWNRKQFTSRLQFLTPEDCAAAPTRGYIVKRVIAPGDVACIFGPPGAGKSAVAPLIAYHVARGEPIFGLRAKQGGVFYVAAEDPAGMANRVAALRRRFGDAPEFTLVTGLTDLLEDNSADRAALLDAIDEQQPSIILIDTMAMAFPDLDENDGKEMGRVVRVARSIAARGPAVVLLHHGTKADGSTPRGHSVLNGALDVAIQIVSSDKGGVIRAKLTKNRNGPCNLDIAFRIGAEELGVDEDGDPITAAIAEPLPAGAAPRGEKLPPSEKHAFEIFEKLHAGGTVVDREWRQECIDSNRLSGSDDPRSHARAFERARLGLIRRGLIVIEGEHVLPCHDFDE